MVEMIERVARALVRRACPPGGEAQFPYVSADEWERKNWRDHTDAARAAIEAMREPSDGMIDAGIEAREGGGSQYYDVYQAMIDAALSDNDYNIGDLSEDNPTP